MASNYSLLGATPSVGVGGFWLVVLFIIVPLGFLVPGYMAQDWDCLKDKYKCGFATGGRYDITLYSWVTDYVLGAEFLLMALFTPTSGAMCPVFFLGFLLEAISWTAGAIPHMMLWQENADAMKYDKHLWPTALATSGLAEIFLFGGMLLAFKQCSGFIVGPLIFFLCGGYGAVLYMSLNDKIALKDWATAGVAQVVMVLLQAIVAGIYLCKSLPSKCPFTIVYILCVAGTFAINQFKFEPFKSNEKFNDNALFHLCAMVTGAAIFQLARCIEMASQAEDRTAAPQDSVMSNPELQTQRIAEEAPFEEEPKRGLFACCGRRVGGWPVSNMQK